MKGRKAKTKPETVTVGNATVKIYSRQKREGYRVFEVADFSQGRRRLRSFSDKAEALKEADRIARMLSTGQVTALELGPRERASYGRAIELLRPTGIPLELAAAHFAEAFKILGGDRIIEAAKFYHDRNPDQLPDRTVSQVVEELIELRKARGKSERYLQDLKSRLDRFADSFRVNIASVGTGDVQAWLDRLKVKPQTAKNFRTVLGTLFKFAEARGYIFKGSNPIEGTERISGANGDTVEIYSPKEMRELLKAAPEAFKPCLALGAFAGLRSAEIERLEWRDVDLKGKHITVAADKAKTASRRLVAITPNLAAWLKPYAMETGPVWKGTHDAFYDAQKETSEAAEVLWKANGLRHSFISYRLAKVQDTAKVAYEAGNSAAVVFKHYRELVRPKEATQWFNIKPEGKA